MKAFNKIVIANWKMHLDVNEAKKQARSMRRTLAKARLPKNRQVVICPDFLAISEVAKILKGSRIILGAQDGYFLEPGSHTGEIAMSHLKKMGCKVVIIGHSERRADGETDKMVNKKILAALDNDLTPILCVGETFDERKEGRQDSIILHQVYEALQNVKLKKGQRIMIAYEPVWVIGSGQAIDPNEVVHISSIIKQSVIDSFDGKYTSQVDIIYGGSVNPVNINQFTELKDTKGTLVCGSTLDYKTFIELVKNS